MRKNITLICPHCGSEDTVKNGGVRGVCRACYRSFNKRDAGYKPIKIKNGWREEGTVKIIKII